MKPVSPDMKQPATNASVRNSARLRERQARRAAVEVRRA